MKPHIYDAVWHNSGGKRIDELQVARAMAVIVIVEVSTGGRRAQLHGIFGDSETGWTLCVLQS